MHVDKMRLVKPQVLTGEDKILKVQSNLNEKEPSDHLDDENVESFSSVDIEAEQELPQKSVRNRRAPVDLSEYVLDFD